MIEGYTKPASVVNHNPLRISAIVVFNPRATIWSIIKPISRFPCSISERCPRFIPMYTAISVCVHFNATLRARMRFPRATNKACFSLDTPQSCLLYPTPCIWYARHLGRGGKDLSTADYLIKVAESTDRNIWIGLSYYLYLHFRRTEENDFSSDLSIGVANLVLRHRAADSEVEQFASRNKDRIELEARNLNRDRTLCELLSGAAYNSGYGLYVASGGSRLFNRFLRFIREDRKNSTTDLAANVIEPIRNLQRLGLWIPREYTPNELDYLKAVQNFAQEQDRLVKQHEKST